MFQLSMGLLNSNTFLFTLFEDDENMDEKYQRNLSEFKEMKIKKMIKIMKKSKHNLSFQAKILQKYSKTMMAIRLI